VASGTCALGHPNRRWWRHCTTCGRGLRWPTRLADGRNCRQCGWAIAPKFAHCPWCGVERLDEPDTPIRQARGFPLDTKCDAGCGGRVMYPMPHCPTCGGEQWWNETRRFEGDCPHCERGVDDRFDFCPWCGGDATGQDLMQRALRRTRRLLLVSRIRPWGYRVLLRPGVSGVDPKYPDMVEIERRYVTGRRRDEIPWTMLTGLICHELGHSFLFHHWRWARSPAFRRAFGDVEKAYRVPDDGWVDFQRRRIAIAPVDHVSVYASLHPQEDFAETFRFYVTRHGRLRDLFAEFGRKRKGVAVYEKFMVLRDYTRSIWRRAPA
jgi:RNA polymerase subunit RPABC4/transcription elongation factor Spt4